MPSLIGIHNTIYSNPVMGGGVPAFNPAAANLNGTTQYIQWNSGIIADGPGLSIIARINPDVVTAGDRFIISVRNQRLDFRISANVLTFGVKDAANNNIVVETGTTNISANTSYIFMASLRTTLGSTAFHVWNENTNFYTGTAVFNNNNNIDFTNTTLIVGAIHGGVSLFDGCLGPVWVSDEYIDFSNAANRALVSDGSGNLVDPGATGSGWSPTSTVPEIYIPDTLNAPGTNSGSGANPALVNGTPFTACAKF